MQHSKTLGIAPLVAYLTTLPKTTSFRHWMCNKMQFCWNSRKVIWNYRSIHAFLASTTTSVEFSRLLTSNDTVSDLNINLTETQNIMWALHTSLVPLNSTAFEKHNYKGVKTISLLKPCKKVNCCNNAARCPATQPYSFVNVTLKVDPSAFSDETFINAVASKLSVLPENVVITRTTQVPEISSSFCPSCTRLVIQFLINN